MVVVRPARIIGAIASIWFALSAVLVPAAPAQLNMARLLDRYAAGDFEGVARIVVEEEAARPGSLMPELRTGGQRWIERAETWKAARARRLVAAAFALEAAGAPGFVTTGSLETAAAPQIRMLSRFEAQTLGVPSMERRALLAWALGVLLDLRSRDQPIAAAVPAGDTPVGLDEAEHQWFLAAVALLSGSGDVSFLLGPAAMSATQARRDTTLATFLPHGSLLQVARRRFPDEPRFRLAQVYADERRTLPLNGGNLIAIQTQTPEDGVIPPRLLRQRQDPLAVTVARPGFDTGAIPTALSLIDSVGAGYEELTSVPAIRDEAWLRLGYHRLRIGERDGAVAAFTEALGGAPDRDVRYLSHFFRGWTLHRANHRAVAERDYEEALRVYPASRQVRVLLASLLADRGDRQGARDVLGEFLSRRLPERDPWLRFHQGDFRFYPERVVAMREALRPLDKLRVASSGVERR